jgi:hypothetical protein
MFFSRTTKPQKLRFTQKLPDIVQIQVCTNHGPRGSGGATMGKTIFTRVYIGGKSVKIFSRTSEPVSIKFDTNHTCRKGIQVHVKDQVLFKGEIIAKMQQ